MSISTSRFLPLCACLAIGCADVASLCGNGGFEGSTGTARLCAYPATLVVEGDLECPADLPFALDVDGALVCSDEPITREELPPDLCARIMRSCGTADAGVHADGATIADATVPVDAEIVLDSSSDSGADAGPPGGVTCVVEERAYEGAMCVGTTTTTYEDVEFRYAVRGEGAYPVWLTSPLEAFRTLYNGDPHFGPNRDGSAYTVGWDDGTGPYEIARSGLDIEVDIDTGRSGSVCVGPEPVPPLIHIRCSGRTRLAPFSCFREIPTVPVPPMSCTVTRRDAACVSSSSSHSPRFWLAAGVHGPASELRSDAPYLAELLGTPGEARFYQEASCEVFLDDAASPFLRFVRDGTRIYASSLHRASSATCRDSLGARLPVLAVDCEGVAELESAP